jgi:hypothetical protein
VFLGAGLDAFAAAQQAGLHLDASRVVSYDRGRSREVFAAASANVAAFVEERSAARLNFSDEQRDQVGDAFTPRQRKPRVTKTRAKAPSSVDDISLS